MIIRRKHANTLFLIAFSAFILTHPCQAEDKFLNIQEVKGKSGVSAWLVEDHTIPVIALTFAFRDAGAKNDPKDKQGLARLASNTMDEGAGDTDSQSFQKELQDLSISLSFNTDRDHFGGSLKTLTENKDRAFELLRLALTKPRFDQEPLDRMRAANQSRIKSSMSEPDWIAARIQNDRIFENHPYALNTGGTLSSLSNITADDLRAFHKTLGKNQMVVGVAGDITPDELTGILDRVFGNLPDTPVKTNQKLPLTNAGKTYLFRYDIPQTIIEISQQGIDRADPDYETSQVMNFILGSSGFGSRLMEEIREKRGLTYGIYTSFRQYEDADVLHASTSTANANVKEILTLTKQEWQKMMDTPVTDKELTDAKTYLIGSLPLSLTSTDSIAGLLESMQLDHLPADYLDSREKKITASTKEDVQKVAKRLLNPNDFTTILVGTPEGVENVEEIKVLPNVE